MIKLSLSGRLFEARGGYERDREAFLDFARAAGYQGVELRYPQMPMETPPTLVLQVRQRLQQLDLTWVFGTVEGIKNPEMFDRAVTTLKQHVAGGALFTRFTIFTPEQIEIAQRFADIAADLGATLLMQLHDGTLVDTVPHAAATMAKLDRPNIKLAYEASHLMFAGDARYVDGIDQLLPHIAAVSLQNYKPAPAGADPATIINIKGKPYVRALPGDPEGLDFAAIFTRLKQVGFAGYATLMCDCIPGMKPDALALQWREYLQSLV